MELNKLECLVLVTYIGTHRYKHHLFNKFRYIRLPSLPLIPLYRDPPLWPQYTYKTLVILLSGLVLRTKRRTSWTRKVESPSISNFPRNSHPSTHSSVTKWSNCSRKYLKSGTVRVSEELEKGPEGRGTVTKSTTDVVLDTTHSMEFP